MIYPAKRFHLAILCLALPGVITAAFAPATVIPLALVAAVLLAIALFDARSCIKRSHLLAITAPPLIRTYRGTECPLPLRISCGAPIKGCVLESRLPELLFHAPAGFECSREQPAATAEARVIALVRGAWPLAAFQVRTESPLKLWQRLFHAGTDAHVHVFANNKSDLHALNGLHSSAMAGIHLQRSLGRGREVDKLREYVQGDSMDDIHWKATARHGRPITKEYRIERSQHLYVVIDASRSSQKIIDYTAFQNLPDKFPLPLIERSIVAADMLLMIATRQSDRIGLAAFDDRVRLFIKPGMGAHHSTLCRSALMRLQPGTAPADYREMFQYLAANIQRRSMILIIADFDDPFASESYAAHVHVIAKKHAVMGICPVDDHVQPLFSRPIESGEQMYGALSGHLKWRALQKTRLVIRAQGSEIVTATPRDLPAATLKAYVSMKRRQIV